MPKVDIPKTEDGKIDWGEFLFQSPGEALRLHGEMVKREVVAMYKSAQGQKTFWEEFYTANPDLRADSAMVQQTISENYEALKDKKVPEAISELADLSRERIKSYHTHRARQREAAVMVGGPGLEGRPLQPFRPEDMEPASLSSAIKARRQRRREWGNSNVIHQPD
jgi:hypothetical protein